MSTYKFSGKIEQGRSENPFTREIEAESAKHAEEILYSQLGSEHNVPRSKISIEEQEEA